MKWVYCVSSNECIDFVFVYIKCSCYNLHANWYTAISTQINKVFQRFKINKQLWSMVRISYIKLFKLLSRYYFCIAICHNKYEYSIFNVHLNFKQIFGYAQTQPALVSTHWLEPINLLLLFSFLLTLITIIYFGWFLILRFIYVLTNVPCTQPIRSRNSYTSSKF